MKLYSKSTGCIYLSDVHGEAIPADAVQIPEDRYNEVIANPAPGKIRSHDSDGLPILIDAPPFVPSGVELCKAIDSAADSARLKVAGDPLRAIEYERAAAEAQIFKDAGYPVESVPRTVAAYAINGRTAQESADSILAESAAYTEALYCLRETRLSAKEQVHSAIQEGNQELAEQVAEQTIATIHAMVGGVGNNLGANA